MKGNYMEQKKYYASLKPSAMAIFNAAADIFSSYVSIGKVNDDNENDMIKKAIKTSIKIASIVDKSVKSDGEIS